MKKFLGFITVCLMMLVVLPVGCFAAEGQDDYSAAAWLEPAVGDWYTTKGEFAMTIEGDSLNGNKINGMSDCTFGYPRTGTFTINENNIPRNIKLELLGNKSHQYLVIDGITLLRRSMSPAYNESMGGIYLGMTKDNLKGLYKEPTSVVQENGTERWNYDSHKFAVLFENDVISAIRIFKGSDRKFDKSLLVADDAPAAYTTAYNFEQYPVAIEEAAVASNGYKIDQGEFFYFRPDYVELSIYKNE